MKVIKRDGSKEEFDPQNIENAILKAFKAEDFYLNDVDKNIIKAFSYEFLEPDDWEIDHEVCMTVESIQDDVEKFLLSVPEWYPVAKAYMLYREKRKNTRQFVDRKKAFINRYKGASNTANATVDDNSNVNGKNIGILNAEIHKEDNIQISRGMIVSKLRELYPDFDAKQYIKDLENHVIYKHDESGFSGAIAPYCCSISMYPFITSGIKDIGGLSAAPKNLDSYCGMYVNLIFAIAAQFAGAVATSEFLVYFDWFARKEWGDNYYLKPDAIITSDYCKRKKTIQGQIHQYFQQVIYSINQPAAARGMQSAFVNFSLFDRDFFNGMFDNFYFPDGDQAKWESVCWLQKDFLHWFNQERLKCILTFPVVSCTLLYKDGKFQDEDFYNFICEEYAQGNSFFLYISDSVDSLSSCCRLKNKIQTKEFNFTNGNMGVETGSKSVISLNLNRIVADSLRSASDEIKKWILPKLTPEALDVQLDCIIEYLKPILERVYKYQTAYNELLWDMYNASLLPVYKAGFIDLNRQYLTIGLIGTSAAAEYLGIEINDNPMYQKFCQTIFGFIKEQNTLHKTKKTTWNTEQVPSESAAIKLYDADKKDGYWVPEDINLYTSYIFKPYDKDLPFMQRIVLHGKNYIGDYLDGGSAAHLNLEEHLSKEQYMKVLAFAAENGCQYLTFNVPNSECEDCGFITKVPISECPKCGSKKIALYDRIIGYLTKIKNWSKGRQVEQKKRVYSKKNVC
jgi:ribonucleoside-triphosphate reductase